MNDNYPNEVAPVWWQPHKTHPIWPKDHWQALLEENQKNLFIIIDPATNQAGLGCGGRLVVSTHQPPTPSYPVRAVVPGLYAEQLGSEEFRRVHGLRFAYVGGSMARGIASPELVMALGQIGALGFYGAAGVPLNDLENNLQRLSQHFSPHGQSWGANLIHSPTTPELEEKVVDLYLKYGVIRVEASAFMHLRPSVVRYACTGLQMAKDGKVKRRNYVFAKVSRPEVAKHFMCSPPQSILNELVAAGKLTQHEAECALKIPVAEDITVESDSGGHTDNRPMTALFSRLSALRAELNAPIRLGLAGGLGTPEALAAAFSLGADYVLLGSVHQATLEAGISESAKKILAQMDIADVGMTASADMFEQGIKVQVLTLGTLMAAHGNKLYGLYKTYASPEEIPAKELSWLETRIFREPLPQAWQKVCERALKRNPERVNEAEQDPKRKMAMLFRAYLGQSSQWPIEGNLERKADYQIWCGPAMGAFNAWTKNSFLAAPENRTIEQVALNLLQGATSVMRAQQIRLLGVPIPNCSYVPRPLVT